MSRRKPSKFRKAKRAQRAAKRDPAMGTITFKSHNAIGPVANAMELGTRVHMLLEANPDLRDNWLNGKFAAAVGDTHIGIGNHDRALDEQLLAYAATAGIKEVLVYNGGDLIQHEGAFDFTRSKKILDDWNENLARVMTSTPEWKP